MGRRLTALVVAAALALPVIIGTAVVIYRSVHDTPDKPEREDLPLIAGFGRIGFTVNDNPTVRCALLAETQAAQEQGMQGMRSLRGYDAMVFAFPGDTAVQFINHFVPIELSIGWYNANGALVDHTTMAPCPDGDNCPTFASKDPFRYAIETPVGGLEAMGLTGGGSVVHLGGGCT